MAGGLIPWISTTPVMTGKFSVSARLLEIQGEIFRLEKADGKIISVPLAKLSQADQDYVQSERDKVQPLSE